MTGDLPFADSDDLGESDFRPRLSSAVQKTLVNTIPLEGSDFIAPFVPCSDELAEVALRYIDTAPNDILVDLGCGDARILVKALSSPNPPLKCIGVELDPYLAEHIRTEISPNYPTEKLKIMEEDMFAVDLEGLGATALCLYLLPKGLGKLRERMIDWLKAGDALPEGSPRRRVVTIVYSIPLLQHIHSQQLNDKRIFFYDSSSPTTTE
ncbi:hypothetical protein HDU67_007318 [Dinochytrium kinnereticum]|nr:hypothetical protein HDU67_007318 [Dinochytrium kinnereticum]